MPSTSRVCNDIIEYAIQYPPGLVTRESRDIHYLVGIPAILHFAYIVRFTNGYNIGSGNVLRARGRALLL